MTVTLSHPVFQSFYNLISVLEDIFKTIADWSKFDFGNGIKPDRIYVAHKSPLSQLILNADTTIKIHANNDGNVLMVNHRQQQCRLAQNCHKILQLKPAKCGDLLAFTSGKQTSIF